MINTATQFPYQATAFLFDLDDTLFDRKATFARWASAFVQAHPLLQDASRQDAIDLLITLDDHGSTPRKDLFAAFQERYPNLYTVEAIIETYYQQFSAYMECDHLFPLLQILQSAHVPFGIVTNGFARQQLPKIAALGLTPLTSCIFISEVFGTKKPDAAIFLAAASYLDVPANQVLFIGDNPIADIYGAHQVGMKTVWIRHFATWPTAVPFYADMTVDSLTEWVALLGDSRFSDK